MKYKLCAIGLPSLCLAILSGCSTNRPPVVPVLTIAPCPPVVTCSLSPASPQTNGDLTLMIEQLRADWASCAAQVDTIVQCQQEHTTTRHD